MSGRRLCIAMVTGLGVAMGTGPGLSRAARDRAEVRRASPPSVSVMAARSSSALQKLRTVHSEADVSTWGTVGSAGVQQLRVHLASDCRTVVTATTIGGWQRIAVNGRYLRSGRPAAPIDTHWIFQGTSGRTGGGRYTFWERSAQTQGKWQRVQTSTVVHEPEYGAILASGGICGGGFSRVIPTARYRYLGAAMVGGNPTWQVRGQYTARDGESFDQHLFIDQRTFLADRAALSYREPINGRVVVRWDSVVTYSRFNTGLVIGAPHVGSATP